jgi:pimeloyl-ACP methyl ester carboxylesterase
MWDPVIGALPAGRRVLAPDLPGHGGTPMLPEPGLAPVVDAVHKAVRAAGIERPIVVGHSIGGPVAAIYASTYPAAGVISVEAPIRLEPFAAMLAALRPQLEGPGFDQAWSMFQQSWRAISSPPAARCSGPASADRRTSSELPGRPARPPS